MRIGILAYGSLIDEPGSEIEQFEVERRGGVKTPFRVEFARSSDSRDGAPTLVPVHEGGSYVEATIIVLRDGVDLVEARDILYRRERNRVRQRELRYKPDPEEPNQVYVELLMDFFSLDYVLYTRIRPNISPLTAEELAKRAVKSAEGGVGARRRDGISYLIQTKENGVTTLLSGAYEKEILKKTNKDDLQSAWESVQPS